MIINHSGLIEHIAAGIKEEVDIAVIGLSGGADSTLTSLLLREALGAKNVYGVIMPGRKEDFHTLNYTVGEFAEHIGINYTIRSVVEISEKINELNTWNAHDTPEQVNAGNSSSRARMCLLYGIAHDLGTKFPGKRVRVIGTGNLSEDFIGYDTKGGDALADIFPIGELFKSEVYQLLDYFKGCEEITEEMIARTPSAGLWEGQTDEEELGYLYDEMEPKIRELLKLGSDEELLKLSVETDDDILRFVIDRHFANRHKHEAPPVITCRAFCD